MTANVIIGSLHAASYPPYKKYFFLPQPILEQRS